MNRPRDARPWCYLCGHAVAAELVQAQAAWVRTIQTRGASNVVVKPATHECVDAAACKERQRAWVVDRALRLS